MGHALHLKRRPNHQAKRLTLTNLLKNNTVASKQVSITITLKISQYVMASVSLYILFHQILIFKLSLAPKLLLLTLPWELPFTNCLQLANQSSFLVIPMKSTFNLQVSPSLCYTPPKAKLNHLFLSYHHSSSPALWCLHQLWRVALRKGPIFPYRF